jgi:hypothetical protein
MTGIIIPNRDAIEDIVRGHYNCIATITEAVMSVNDNMPILNLTLDFGKGRKPPQIQVSGGIITVSDPHYIKLLFDSYKVVRADDLQGKSVNVYLHGSDIRLNNILGIEPYLGLVESGQGQPTLAFTRKIMD